MNDYEAIEENDNRSVESIDHSDGREMDADSLEQLEEKEAVVNDFLERNGSVESYENTDLQQETLKDDESIR